MSSIKKSVTDLTAEANRQDSDMYLAIDHPFQLAILRRVGAYAILGIIYFAAISLTTDSMADPHFDWHSMWMKCCDEAVYWAPGLLFILPTLAIDLLRFTRRFTLPVNRVAQEIRLLTEGKSESPLVLDGCEAWENLAREFNELREELLELRQSNMLNKPGPTAFSAVAAVASRHAKDEGLVTTSV